MPVRFDRPTAVICAIGALNALGLGLIMPVMPALLADFDTGSIARAASIGGLLSLVFAVMQFLCSPMLGALSDRYGRRPVLLGSLALSALDYLLMAIAPYLWILFIGRMISGVSSSTFAVASAYLTDRSTNADRAGSLGVLGAAFGIGFVMGPFVGSLLGAYGPRVPFLVAAMLSFVAFVVAYLILPETLARSMRRPVSRASINPFAPLFYLRQSLPIVLLGAFFLDAMAGFTFPAVWAYYGAVRFDWDATMIGISFGVMGVGFAVAQATLVRPTVARLGNIGTVRLALSAGIVGFLAMFQTDQGLLALMILPTFAVLSLARTGLAAQMSIDVADDAQGGMQGTLASISALASIIAFPLMSQAFSWGAEIAAPEHGVAGLPFLIAAAFCALSLVFLTVFARPIVSHRRLEGAP